MFRSFLIFVECLETVSKTEELIQSVILWIVLGFMFCSSVSFIDRRRRRLTFTRRDVWIVSMRGAFSFFVWLVEINEQKNDD